MHKREVKRGGCNTHYIRIMDLINHINLGSKFVRLIEPCAKIERFLVKKVFFLVEFWA